MFLSKRDSFLPSRGDEVGESSKVRVGENALIVIRIELLAAREGLPDLLKLLILLEAWLSMSPLSTLVMFKAFGFFIYLG